MSNGVDTWGGPDRFRKKPVEIEAVQFAGADFPHGFGAAHIVNWIGDHGGEAEHIQEPNGWDNAIAISTLEGTMHAVPGDWIIRGVKGEFYPCKPDIFAATYEPVEDEP